MGSVPPTGPEPSLFVMARVAGKPYFLYVLWSASARRFYIGISEDTQRRLEQHHHGISRWTARYGPWELVHEERYENYRDARLRENELKRQKGGQNFFKLTGLSRERFRASGS